MSVGGPWLEFAADFCKNSAGAYADCAEAMREACCSHYSGEAVVIQGRRCMRLDQESASALGIDETCGALEMLGTALAGVAASLLCGWMLSVAIKTAEKAYVRAKEHGTDLLTREDDLPASSVMHTEVKERLSARHRVT
jgi:hypothetical protein